MSYSESTVLSTRGQVVLPASVRKRHKLTPGTKVNIRDGENGEIILTPITHELIRRGRGMLKSKGSVLEELMKEKELERQRDQKRLQ